MIKNKKGFSLIEMLIALVILYLCLPSFFNFLSNSIFRTKFTSSFSNAIILGQEKLEELMYKPFDDTQLSDSNTSNNLNLNPDIDKNQILNNFSDYASSNFDHYEITIFKNTKFYIFWNIADDTTISSLLNYKRIVVIIYWIEFGKGHKITFQTIRRSS